MCVERAEWTVTKNNIKYILVIRNYFELKNRNTFKLKNVLTKELQITCFITLPTPRNPRENTHKIQTEK